MTAIVVAGVAGACGSDARQGYAWTSPYRQDIRTISVPTWDNATHVRDIEFQLTEAIIKEVHRSTPWKVVSPGAADTTLSGVITDAQLRKLGTQSVSGLVQELAVDIAVTFEWKESRTGKVLVAKRNFRTSEPFVPAQGAQERLELGERSTIDQMAKEIVAELRSSW